MRLLPLCLKGQACILSEYFKWKKTPTTPTWGKKFKDRFTVQNVWLLNNTEKTQWCKNITLTASMGWKFPPTANKLKSAPLKISVLALHYLVVWWYRSPHYVPHAVFTYWALRSTFHFKKPSLFKSVLWIHPTCNIQLLPQTPSTQGFIRSVLAWCLCQRMLKKST